jgi:hypothetical protein
LGVRKERERERDINKKIWKEMIALKNAFIISSLFLRNKPFLFYPK